MDRDRLRTEQSHALRKWARTLADGNGEIPAGLLDELTGIAANYAAGLVAEARVTGRPSRKPAAEPE